MPAACTAQVSCPPSCLWINQMPAHTSTSKFLGRSVRSKVTTMTGHRKVTLRAHDAGCTQLVVFELSVVNA